jgi:prepilin-type N-terminal cleavage/methylation domain-containing protein
VRRGRPAYTLFELMLVLALITILAALAIPSLEAMYGQYRLTAAVDQVRGAWATARAHALDEGVPYRFSIMPYGSSYRIAPDGTAPQESSNSGLVLEETLPKGVRFSLINAAGSGDINSSPPPGNTDSSTWFGVAVFLPDGTTRQDVELLFEGRGARSRILSLRALTGIVTPRNAPEGGRP